MSEGGMVISLDFELIWGVFDKIQLDDKRDYFLTTRRIIPDLLENFEDSNIHVTWATVGMLFNSDWDDWNYNIPSCIPDYHNKKLSPYTFGKDIQTKENEKLCFAPDIIQKIHSTKGQEIGTHTYSHYYSLEKGQKGNDFYSDISKAVEIAERDDIKIKSLVFPRNQFNEEYLEICKSLNLLNIRSNPKSWYWENTQNDGFSQKIFRTGDAYFGKLDKAYKISEIEHYKNKYNLQKASRFLRPYSSIKSLNNLRLKRILREIEEAAQNGKIYHLWWHPHNFGNQPYRNLEDLKTIIKQFKSCQNKYGFKSLNMGEVGLVSKT